MSFVYRFSISNSMGVLIPSYQTDSLKVENRTRSSEPSVKMWIGVLDIIPANCTITVEGLCRQNYHTEGIPGRHDMVVLFIGELFEWYQRETMGVHYESDGPRIRYTDRILCDGTLVKSSRSRQCAWCTVQGISV